MFAYLRMVYGRGVYDGFIALPVLDIRLHIFGWCTVGVAAAEYDELIGWRRPWSCRCSAVPTVGCLVGCRLPYGLPGVGAGGFLPYRGRYRLPVLDPA